MAIPITSVPLIGVPGNWEELEHSYASLQTWLGTLNSNFQAVSSSIAAGDVIASAARADIPTLTTADEGTIYYVTDFAHMVRWSGTAWTFMDGGNRFFADHETAPGTGWALCDGSTVNAMTVGASLGTASVTLPNLTGTAAYKKSGAAYTGTPVAAVAPTAANESAHTHTGPSHTHPVTGSTGSENQDLWITSATVQAGTGDTVMNNDFDPSTHNHSAGTLATSAAGTGATGAGSAHTHVLTDGDHRHLVTLPYYRL